MMKKNTRGSLAILMTMRMHWWDVARKETLKPEAFASSCLHPPSYV
jgi:hypothetical protein